jgi:hypothetical protein
MQGWGVSTFFSTRVLLLSQHIATEYQQAAPFLHSAVAAVHCIEAARVTSSGFALHFVLL